MNTITEFIKREKEYQAILTILRRNRLTKEHPMLISGLCEGAKSAFCAALCEDVPSELPLLLLTDSEKQAQKYAGQLAELGKRCAVYPMRDFVFHDITASHEYEHERLSVLANIGRGKLDAVIATPDAAAQYTMPPEVMRAKSVSYRVGDVCDLEQLIRFLSEIGYVRVETVDGMGQFAVRGGIVDIFVTGDGNPHRMELFGDEIDSIGLFDVITQRKTEICSGFEITPARELLLTEAVKEKLLAVVREEIKKAKSDSVKGTLRRELEEIENKAELSFRDKYISLFYEAPASLFDYFKKDGKIAAVFVADNPNGIRDKLQAYEKLNAETVTAMLESGELLGRIANYHLSCEEYQALYKNTSALALDLFAGGNGYLESFVIRSKSPLSYRDMFHKGTADLMRDDLRGYIKNRYAVILLCENEISASGFVRGLSEDFPEIAITDGKTALPCESLFGKVTVVCGVNAAGFELITGKFICISLYINPNSHAGVLSSRTNRKLKKISAKEKILSYADLQEGDYVVHDVHGIGLYKGMKNLTSYDGVSRDFLSVEYADGAMLYVPCDRLDVLAKYIGARSQDGSVRLSKMGGTEWGRTKERVKTAVREMAKELIALYAKRMRRDGHAFPKDDDMQRQFEAAFEYEETEGQLLAAEEIKKDMESSHPMDRLLCGDVGFGKTEVALRAAFKAVSDGKQVAILVPTTILALQHYQTILARMRGFPVNVDVVSRFKTPKQQAETLRRLKRGDIDIIVGTHRLVSKDVSFKDLGLIIIDEEQRFGVAHKEKLKQISDNADVLTLTATPIPRTLNMAISGIRDMSVLDEAPGDRMPPQTFVMEYDEMIVSEAIRKELRRGGQVFYLHNTVEGINNVAYRVSKLAPDAVIAVAHGQMDKDELADIWQALVAGEIDILVSTTIVETGIDIPNANTMIIENADKMGLSQLHQLRGRIGRSSRRSYAYLTYKKDKTLSEIAQKRLMAIKEFTEFSSGFKIALRDLEIRGAGNLLGAEQHGHMDSVGYDMYVKLLNTAVLEETGKTEEEKTDCRITLPYSAFIPQNYIRDTAQRIEIYKKISHIEDEADMDDIADELLDRFGNLPPSVENLLEIAYIRALGCLNGIQKIEGEHSEIRIYLTAFDFALWSAVSAQTGGRLKMSLGASSYAVLKIKSGENGVLLLKKLLLLLDAQRKKKSEASEASSEK